MLIFILNQCFPIELQDGYTIYHSPTTNIGNFLVPTTHFFNTKKT